MMDQRFSIPDKCGEWKGMGAKKNLRFNLVTGCNQLRHVAIWFGNSMRDDSLIGSSRD